jgi:tetraacyldisaccharide 4'-kinase
MINPPKFWLKRCSLLSLLLRPLGWVYGSIVFLRFKLTLPTKVKIPVVCVGNLTLGGTGKTPVILSLAKFFQQKKIKVGVLTRGYGGNLKGPVKVEKFHKALDVGDEALLLAKRIPTWVSRDRAKGARMMVSAGVQLILMDDGFQNPGLSKDLNLVVVDSKQRFGNGQVFPSGPLREFLRVGMGRADAFVLMGENSAFLEKSEKPVFKATLVPSVPLPDQQKYFAFAGIGFPEKFFETLKKAKVKIVGTASFRDHHPYGEEEFKELLKKAQNLSALLLTTEKDWVRLTPAQRKLVVFFPIEVKWDSEKILEKFLKERLHGSLD